MSVDYVLTPAAAPNCVIAANSDELGHSWDASFINGVSGATPSAIIGSGQFGGGGGVQILFTAIELEGTDPPPAGIIRRTVLAVHFTCGAIGSGVLTLIADAAFDGHPIPIPAGDTPFNATWSLDRSAATQGQQMPAYAGGNTALEVLSFFFTAGAPPLGTFAILAVSLTHTYDAVSVDSVSLDTGDDVGGQVRTINGAGFLATDSVLTAVTFGGVAATEIAVTGDGTITCRTPAHAIGAVDVALEFTDPTTLNAAGFTLTAGFTYVASGGGVPTWYEYQETTGQQTTPDSSDQVDPQVAALLDATTGTDQFPTTTPVEWFTQADEPPGAGWVPTRDFGSDLKPSTVVQDESIDVLLTFLNSTTHFQQGVSLGVITPGTGITIDQTAVLPPSVAENGDAVQTIRLSLTLAEDADLGANVVTVETGAATDVVLTALTVVATLPDPPAPRAPGWFWSGDGFSSQAIIASGGVPGNPRTYADIGVFATGSTGYLGGMPGLAAGFKGQLLYAGKGTPPAIRIFDGISDRRFVAAPPVAGVVPIGILSMLTADGKIWFSTLDSGTTSANWLGRVFSLQVDRAQIEQIGATFPAGHVPYALAFHNGWLWCGTHRQNPAAAGKVYYIRPGIDTAWTEDRDLATDSVRGVTSLRSFQGLLFVGTSAAAGTFAKVLTRSPLGAWATSLTGSGGAAAQANNGFPYLVEYQRNLYASFWNDETPAISKIYQFTGSAWSTVLASGIVTRPLVGLFEAADVLYALGGGMGLTAKLLRSPQGTTWTDVSAFLPGSNATAVPAFGSVGL